MARAWRKCATTDAASYATDRGLTLAEARTALADQAAAGDILERLEQEFPTFAGGWIEHGPAVSAVARFQGSVPQGATAIAAGRVKLIGGAGSTLAQLRARMNEVHDAVAGSFGTTVATGLDVETGLVQSRSEARRAFAEGGAYLNNERAEDPDYVPTDADFVGGRVMVLRRGKKNFAGVSTQ